MLHYGEKNGRLGKQSNYVKTHYVILYEGMQILSIDLEFIYNEHCTNQDQI